MSGIDGVHKIKDVASLLGIKKMPNTHVQNCFVLTAEMEGQQFYMMVAMTDREYFEDYYIFNSLKDSVTLGRQTLQNKYRKTNESIDKLLNDTKIKIIDRDNLVMKRINEDYIDSVDLVELLHGEDQYCIGHVFDFMVYYLFATDSSGKHHFVVFANYESGRERY